MATITVLTGALRGQEFTLSDDLTIGRNPDSSIFLDDLQVSRTHAVIENTPSGVRLRDLGSGNGTYVSERRILEHWLRPGDVIQVGPVELRFDGDAQPQARESSSVRFEDHSESMTLESSKAENVYQTFFSTSQAATTQQQFQEAQKRLAAVYEANQIIASERDLDKLFGRVLDRIFALVPAHSGVIMLKDDKSGELRAVHSTCGEGRQEVVVSRTIVSRASENAEAVLTFDAADDSRFNAGASIIRENITSAMCVPLQHQETILGVIYVDTRGTRHAFTQGDLELLVALAHPAAIAIRNAQYLHKLEQAYHDTLIVLANAIELRDHYTVGHTWRVTNFSKVIARRLGWDAQKVRECEMGGVLHDVGKIAVDDAILRKPSRLTDEEYAKMKIHPERGAQMMRDVEFLKPLIPYCLYHHERWDGKGYPGQIAGDDIPLEGRIVAVADTFDAMTSNRPYRKGLDPEVAIEELEKGKETQFDPACVDALVSAYRAGDIESMMQDFAKGEKSIACPFCSTHIAFDDTTKAGDIITCAICHRSIMVAFSNEAYFGELIPESEIATTDTET